MRHLLPVLIGAALLLLAPRAAHAQRATLTGTVTGDDGRALPGATVRVDGTFIGTTTDYDGRFALSGLEPGPVTVDVRYLGYRPATRTVQLAAGTTTLDVVLEEDVLEQSALLVESTRASARTPVAVTNVSNEEIEAKNLGQDLPVLLDAAPSVVVSSDAGAGVGYTDMRIRGTDVTRINVTVNGVPLNDSESQGVFWVNMPDFASSLDNVQIQRGVGTSTNGGAAFGATVNLLTAGNASEPFAEAAVSGGSFDTQKYTLQLGTGLLGGRWALGGRLSQITSDGYVDRAAADLRSYFVQGGYYGDRTVAQLVHFRGHEETYQAWYGTPEAALTGDRAALEEYAATEGLTPREAANLLASDRRYNHYLYDNEVDDYGQAHYQLHLIHAARPDLDVNVTLHYTAGRGFFEQFREEDAFADYGLPDVVVGGETVAETDLVRRRWLDNDFYGLVGSALLQRPGFGLTLGGGYNRYVGDHFGEIIWAEFAGDTDIRDRYYDGEGRKRDGNVFAKLTVPVTARVSVYGDAQVRAVGYEADGIDNDLRPIAIDETFTFFNPKAGVDIAFDARNRLWGLVAVAHREPTRSDYLDAALEAPTAERLVDYELGAEHRARSYFVSANLYYMDYTDQLVATGELNDVGALVKVNVPESYRRGIELRGGVQLHPRVRWSGNYTYSRNRIADFTEVVYDYTDGFDVVLNPIEDTEIALSPSHVGASVLEVTPLDGLEVGLTSKYVGEQYLDNTSNPDRTIDAFFVNDLRFAYRLDNRWVERAELTLLVNNLFDVAYSARGYTYTYIYGEQYTRNHYYPQAGRHALVGLDVRF